MSKKELLIKQYNEKLDQKPNVQVILFVVAVGIEHEISQETECIIVNNKDELLEVLNMFDENLYLIKKDGVNMIGLVNQIYFAVDVEEV